ncbi:MAG TPA: methylenetetrahydrofolate reductase [Candidatus Thermoplasmatota archaeon]|nr:methylenetetrahydrofolate reductase [Candidatus Thermoplasmatota archaeon]
MTTLPFRERVHADAFPVTYEVISPRGADVEKYLAEVEALQVLGDLCGLNVTNNPSARVRVDPAAFGHLLLDRVAVDVLPHVTCRDDTLAGIQRWLFGAWALGLRNVVVMTGDHPKEGDYPEEKRVDSVNAIELIAGIKRYIAKGYLIPDVVSASGTRYANRLDPPKPPKTVPPVDFFVGSPLIPWRNNEVQYAKAKRDAGADFFQTQITWDEKPVLEWLQKAEAAEVVGPDVPVLVGTAPLKTLRTMQFMNESIPHVRVPPDVQARLKAAKDPGWESVEVCSEMIARLKDGVRDHGLKTKLGIHVLPINDNALGSEIVRRAGRL